MITASEAAYRIAHSSGGHSSLIKSTANSGAGPGRRVKSERDDHASPGRLSIEGQRVVVPLVVARHVEPDRRHLARL